MPDFVLTFFPSVIFVDHWTTINATMCGKLAIDMPLAIASRCGTPGGDTPAQKGCITLEIGYVHSWITVKGGRKQIEN